MARREKVVVGPGSRALVVDLIRSSGPISRVELVSASGLTPASISNIVRKLLGEGVIREAGTTPSAGGKPRTLLTINAHAVYGMGMHLATDSITCVVTDTSGGIIGRQLVQGVGDVPPATAIERLEDLFHSVADGLGLTRPSLAGLAVVGPGPVDVDAGVLPLPGGKGRLELGGVLAERLGVPVLVCNDAAAATIGEFWGRQVSRERTFGCLYRGHGIGAGMVLDGSLYRGASSNAGEIGHVTVIPNGVACPCGNYGCLECYAGPPVVVERAKAIPGFAARLGITDQDSNARFFDQLARAAMYGDAQAEALVRTSVELIADAAITLVNLWDLDTLVLAGPGFAVTGSKYVSWIRERLAERARARACHGVQVDLSGDPRDSAAIGGAALVLQSSVAPGHGPHVPSPRDQSARVVVHHMGVPVAVTLIRGTSALRTEPWFHEFIAGIERVLVPCGIPVLYQVVPTMERACERMRSWAATGAVRGIILLDLAYSDERVEVARDLGLPAVVVGDPIDEPGLTTVRLHDDLAMRSAVSALADAGHTRIGHVSGIDTLVHTVIRREAFLAAVEEFGLVGSVFDGDYSARAGAYAVSSLVEMESKPTALLFDNDVMAVAGLDEAARLGIRVPEDLSLIAWDDSSLCQLADPPLSAVSHDVQSLGEVVGRAMADALAGAGPRVIQAEPTQLVIRGSSSLS